ncbi:MAG: hypothetical protein Pg6C_09460 [Treponemataceae bacterium]|nr:MAG: hypothetical protein Pg6C_09460 [Treponemataceae bacterium]
MYAPGLAARQIQEHLKDICAAEVSTELISRVTDGVKELAAEWRGSPAIVAFRGIRNTAIIADDCVIGIKFYRVSEYYIAK